MLIKIGKEWLTKEEGGCFTATHLSPSQLNKIPDQWFYDYCVLTAELENKPIEEKETNDGNEEIETLN
jgi:hypothetical protein